ncbi:hypothetical protein D3C72_1579470 [compost metagenome]
MALTALLQSQCLGQLDHLPLAEAQFAAQHARVDIQVDLGQLQPRRTVQLLPVQPAEARELVFTAHEQVLCHRQVGQDRLLLVDHRDALGSRTTRAVKHDRLAVQLQVPLIRLIDAGENLHQCRLARTVFANQADDFMFADLQVDTLEDGDAIEALGNIVEREHDRPPHLTTRAFARSRAMATAAMISTPCTPCWT